MIYIDFYGGTHGNFLEFLVNRFILKKEEFRDFVPFKKAGTSHMKPRQKNSSVIARHWSFYDDLSATLHSIIKPDDLLIRIRASDDDIYSLVYNASMRGGDQELDLFSLEVNTLEKLSLSKFLPWRQNLIDQFGERANYPRSVLRNNLYYQLLEKEYFFDIATNFKNFTDNCLEIKFSDFFNKESMKNALAVLAEKMHNTVDLTGFDKVWEEFDKKIRDPRSNYP